MAAATPPALPVEYIRIFDIPGPSSLPVELRGHRLYSRVEFVHAPTSVNINRAGGESTNAGRAQQTSGRILVQEASSKSTEEKAAGFNYGKALKAGLEGAGSSVARRGDGKFADGQDFAVSNVPGGRAKFVHLTPDALAPGNAERTLQELDRLQQRAGAAAGPSGQQVRTTSTAVSVAAPRGPPASRSGQQQHAAALATAARTLYDIGDDDTPAAAAPTATSGPAGTAATATAPQASKAAPAGGLRIPEYTVRQLAGRGPAGQDQLEVAVLLPEVLSPGEVEVWLGNGGVLQVAVLGRYHLKLDLPYPVVDDSSQAKWSKAKKRLALTLTRAN